MSKLNIYKIGQKIRCINASHTINPSLTIGRIYTVTRVSGIGTIMVKGFDGVWYNENRFEQYNDYLDEELFIL